MTIRFATSSVHSEIEETTISELKIFQATREFLWIHERLTYVIASVVAGIVAFAALPRVLRIVHSILTRVHSCTQSFSRKEDIECNPGCNPTPYKSSVWRAMQTPARVFFSLFTILQIGGVAFSSSAFATEHLPGLLSGGGVICFGWFLYRLKEIYIQHGKKEDNPRDKELYDIVDKLASFAVIVITGVGFAQVLNMPVSSALALGGVGGLVAAYASKELLSNILSGFHLSFAKPFVAGDSIKVGTVEGKVKEVGFMSTRIRTREHALIVVPNSFFASQAISSTSREPWRRMERKIPIKIQNLEVVREITSTIREMLCRNQQVPKDVYADARIDFIDPECRISQVSAESWVVEISCTMKSMSKTKYIVEEEKILLRAVQMMIACGAAVGGVRCFDTDLRSKGISNG